MKQESVFAVAVCGSGFSFATPGNIGGRRFVPKMPRETSPRHQRDVHPYSHVALCSRVDATRCCCMFPPSYACLGCTVHNLGMDRRVSQACWLHSKKGGKVGKYYSYVRYCSYRLRVHQNLRTEDILQRLNTAIPQISLSRLLPYSSSTPNRQAFFGLLLIKEPRLRLSCAAKSAALPERNALCMKHTHPVCSCSSRHQFHFPAHPVGGFTVLPSTPSRM